MYQAIFKDIVIVMKKLYGRYSVLLKTMHDEKY